MTEKLDFPNKTDLKNALTIEFKVIIPSTRDYNIKISNVAFTRRVSESVNFLTQRFGGSTIDVSQGTYLLEGKTIKERVAVILINADKNNYNKYDKEIKAFLQAKKKSWGQDSMGFSYQGKLIFV